MYLLDNETTRLIKAEIVLGQMKEMPLKKDGWNFNWRTKIKTKNSTTYIIRLKSNPSKVQGVLCLKREGEMLIMDLVEIAPINIGKEKRYSYVAGCLIAFACQETFKMESSYKGFLSFESKTKLIKWYQKNYYAQVAMGQKMFIDPVGGERLIYEYLKRKNN